MTGRRAALVAIVMVAVVGCTSGAEPTASGDTDPQPTPALAVDTVAVVATDDLRVQMLPKPGSEYGSGWLQSGVKLYLVRGPVRADGSDWYQVLPLTQPDEDYGWVAAASPSGEPWIKPLAGVPDCPDTPSTVADLVDLTAGVRLACFRGAPLTVQALLYTVGWRAIPDADDSGAPGPPEKLAPIMLVDPQFNGTAQASALDPASVPTDALSYEEFVQASQDALGAGAVVEVTGMFDHPDAAGCAWNTLEAVADEPDPPYCRPEFVVTGIEPTPGASSGPQTAPALAVDTVAVVVADDVMERELPRPEVSDLNERPLPRGLQLYVVGGPVRAGGSEWYQVVGLDEDNDGFGWVRGASPSGEPWITPLVDAPDCPDTPGTVTDLARLTSGVRLACFSGVPITVQALLYTFGWTANPDDPSISGMTSDPPDALAPIMLMDPQGDEIDLALVLDPASVPPDAVNFEAAVEASPGALSPVFEVTGMFDHPDAAGCIWNEREADRIGPEPDPPYCRRRQSVALRSHRAAG